MAAGSKLKFQIEAGPFIELALDSEAGRSELGSRNTANGPETPATRADSSELRPSLARARSLESLSSPLNSGSEAGSRDEQR